MRCMGLELYLGVGLVGMEVVNMLLIMGRPLAWYLISLIYGLIFVPTIFILFIAVVLSYVSS